MLLRIALFLSMAFGLAGLGGVGWIALHNAPPAPAAVVLAQPAPAPAPPVRTSIVVAAKPLRAGNLLKPDDFTLQEVAQNEVSANAVPAPKAGHSADLVGAMLRRSVQPNEPLLTSDVMMPGERGFLAAVLKAGMRAATVGVDAVSGSAGLIWPGDRVDLILTQAIEDQKLPLGKRLAGETVLRDVRVVAVDSALMRGAVGASDSMQQSAKTLTLEVTPEQAERVAVALRIGKVGVVVRAADDVPNANDGRDRTTWASDVSRALGPRSSDGGSVVHVFLGTAEDKEFHF